MSLNEKDITQMNVLAEKFGKYSKPSKAQSLFVDLASKPNRNNDDDNVILTILEAEKARARLAEKNKKVDEIFSLQKAAERKAIERKKFVIGGALYNAIKQDKLILGMNAKALLIDMINQNLVAERDYEALLEFVPELQKLVDQYNIRKAEAEKAKQTKENEPVAQ